MASLYLPYSCALLSLLIIVVVCFPSFSTFADGRSPSLMVEASSTNTMSGAGQAGAYSSNEEEYSGGGGGGGGGGGQRVWCVGKPAAEDEYLRRNIDYACGQEGVDCRLIEEGASCFLPDTPIAHASFAMNLYYQQRGRNWWNCHFNNTGLVVFTDPSFGSCKYSADWGI